MRKVLSLMLILAMLLTMASFPAFAAEQVVSGSIPWSDSYMQANSWDYSPWLDNDETTGDGTYQPWSDEIATTPFYNGEGELLGNYFELDLGAEYDVESVVIKWGNYSVGWGYTAPIAYSISYAGEDKVYGEATSYTDLHQKYVDGTLPANLVASTNVDYKDTALINLDATETNVGTVRYVKVELNAYQYKAYIRDIVVTIDDGTGGDEPNLTDAVTLLGSSIRLEKDGLSAGLRFGATIDKASAGINGTYVYSDENDVKFGMYLLPADLLGEADTLTEYIAAGGDEALDVPAKKIYEQDEETITYTAVLTGIPESGYAREIVAVPYVIVGGDESFHAEVTDSYVAVARKALDSYNNGNPNEISPEDFATLKEIVGDTSVEPTKINIVSVTADKDPFYETEWDFYREASYAIDGTNGSAGMSNWDRFETRVEINAESPMNMIFTLDGEYQISTMFMRFDTWGYIRDGVLYGTNDLDGEWDVLYTLEDQAYETEPADEVNWAYGESKYATVDVNSTGGYRYLKLVATRMIATGANVYEIEFTGIPTEGAGEDPAPSLEYYNIDAAASAQGLNYEGAVLPASLFVDLNTTYAGYEINGSYKVDAETLRMLTTVDCIGDGTIAYINYREFASYIATVDSSWGQYDDQGYGVDNYGDQIKSAPVSKLSDPVYMSMVLASEAPTYQNKDDKPEEHQNNGVNMHKPSTDTVFDRINALGAIYVNKDLKSELKSNYSNSQVTVCISNVRLLIRTASGWIERNVAVPTAGFGMLYALPWQLEWELGSESYAQQLCINVDNSMTQYSNYTAIKMDVADFLENKNGHWWTGSTSFDERTFHFWGNVHTLSELGISEDTEVLGVIASYEVWVEEEELAPYFVASVGADWRLESGATRQAFAGHQIVTTTNKQILFGHSFGAEDYETYVASDLDNVKAMLDIQ